MNKALSIFAIIIVVIIAVLALRTQLPQSSPDTTLATNTLRVSASFYPIAEFVTQVGGNYVQVSTVVPPNTSPHGFEPTAQEIIKLYSSKLLIYNGGAIDPWAFRLENGLNSKHIATANLLEKIGLSQTSDSHVWLDPLLAQKEVLAIRDALLTADPVHDIQYRLNAYNFNKKLAQLDQSYKSGLAHCTTTQFTTTHQGFNYLATRYKLELNSAGVTVNLNPIETLTTEQQTQGKNYLSLMQDNLKILRAALKCR